MVKRFFLSASLALVVSAGGLAQAEEKLLDRVVAIVDDGVILQSDLESRMLTVKSRLNAQGTPLPADSILRERILDQLLRDQVQLQLAEGAGMRISDTELNQTIVNIAQGNDMTLQEFEAALANEGLTYQEAREQIRREMLISRIQQRQVEPRIRITEREVQNFLESQSGKQRSGEEYLIGHILIEVEDSNNTEQVEQARAEAADVLSDLRSGADFRQTAVERSDGGNALDGGVLGWRSEDQLPSLIADVAPNLETGNPSELLQSPSGFHIVTVLERRGGEEQTVQQSQVRHILVATDDATGDDDAEAQIHTIRERIEGGEAFADLARELSDDTGSGSDGGNLGWVSPGEMVPAFEEVMQSVQPGQVSEPFRTRFGWHILEVQDRRLQDISDQLQTAEARQVLYRRKYDVELRAWLREIREEAFVEIKSEREGDNAS